MESLTGEDSPEDIPERKKSKLKILKSRLFRRHKKGDEDSYNLSQSTSDITAGKGLNSEEDLTCTEVMLGSRALSHDSIFVAEEVLADPEPTTVLSQENVHSKIKALQVKLQQQKLNLGPPPMGLSIKRPDLGRSPTSESAPQEALNKEILQPSARPLSPAHKQSPTRFVAPTPSHPAPPAVPSTSPVTAADLASDFSSPAQVVLCLDTSAARHRMSVKPRNQRASTKGRKHTTNARPLSYLPNNMNHPALEEETSCPSEEESSIPFHSIHIPQSELEGVNVSFTPQCLYSDSLEGEAIKREAQAASQPESSGTAPLGAKSHQPIDLKYWQQPASSCVMTEGNKTDRLAGIEIQAASHVKGNDFNSTGLMGKKVDSEHSSQEVSTSSLPPSFGSVGSFRSSSLNQHGKAQQVAEGTQRHGQGPGSFHFSSVKGQAGERPRSSSFVVHGKHAVTRPNAGSETLVKSFTSNVNQPEGHEFQKNRQEEEHSGDVQQQRGARIAKDGEDKGAFISRKRMVPLKKGESAQPPKQAPVMTGAVAGEEGGQEGIEEAVDAKEDQEEQGTAAFGVKLRSTTQSLRYRTEGSPSSVKRNSAEMAMSAPPLLPSNHTSASLLSGEKADKRIIGEETTNRGGTRPWSFRHTGGAPNQPGFLSLPDKPNLMEQAEVSVPTPETLHISTSNSKEMTDTQQHQTAPQSAPQSATADVSWMSMAMDKTRSLQQLFTSKMPRDFTGMQSNARQQTPAQPTNQGQNDLQFQANKGIQSQTQAVVQQHDMPQIQATSQPLTEAMKQPELKAASSAQTAKPSQVSVTVQQNIPLNASITTHMQNTTLNSKQAHNMPCQPNIAQPIIQSSTHAASCVFTAPSALRPSTQMESMAQSALGSTPYSLAQANVSSGQPPAVQQPSRGGGGLQHGNQFKPMTSAPTTSNTAPSPAQAPALAPQGGAPEEGASQSGRRTVWQTPALAPQGGGPEDGASQSGRTVCQTPALAPQGGAPEEGASQSGRRPVWQTSVGERAAFLEYRTDGGATHGFKVDQTKSQANTQSSVESPYSIFINKDPTSERRPGGQIAASSPTKVPGRLADNEEKKARQRTQTSSPSSSSATPSSPLQSASDRSQPSWMELAKRKSMAWSDKTMD